MDLKQIKGAVGSAMYLEQAVRFIYVTKTKVSIRLVIPYRWRTINNFISLDLGRDEIREFKCDNIRKIVLVKDREAHPPFYTSEIIIPK